MSGGHYNRAYSEIRDLADRIYGDVTLYSQSRKGTFSDDVYEPLPASTLADMRFVAQLLEIASDAAHDVEWMMSGDTGEDAFGRDVEVIRGRLMDLLMKGGSDE